MLRRSWLAGVGLLAVAGAGSARAKTTDPGGMAIQAVQFPAWHTVDGAREPLSPGDLVTTRQVVETGPDAALVLQMEDGSTVRLGEKSRLEVREYKAAAELGQRNINANLRVADGFFRYVTAAAAEVTARRDIRLELRTVTVGIRGTDFWAMTDAVHDAACLFQGKIELDTRDQGRLVLEQPTAFWARFFDQPVKPVGNATPQELEKFLRSTELRPGSGVATQGGRWRTVAAALGSRAGAQALAQRLRLAGFPAVLKARQAGTREIVEVRINQLATREDAAAVLRRIASIEGVNGRVALSA